MIDDILKSLEISSEKKNKEFEKRVEFNKKKIAKDPNEFFLDLPSTPMKSPKNKTDIKLD